MASRIPQSFIDDLLERVDIVDYINARVPLKKSGKNFSACCPFHDEKTPSFTVSREKQFYYCFGCQAGGNIVGFAMDHHGLSFPEAVEQIAKENGIEVPREAGENKERTDARKKLYDTLQACDSFYRKALRDSSTAIDYLKNRYISGTTARDFGIGYAPDGWDNIINELGKSSEELVLLERAGMVIKRENKDGYYDRFRDRVMFPIRDTRGRTVAFGGRVLGDEKPKYLNSPETDVFHKSYELYGLFETHRFAPKTERLIVVEGYMDVVSLYEQGIKGAVATLGTAVTSHHLEKIFRHVAEVIFCFDGDEAGRTAADRALHAALPLMIDGRQARFLFLPEGEDPDTRVQAIGADAFEQELQGALPLSDYVYQSVDADMDLSSPDARAKLHSLVQPLINKLPKGVFRRLMEQELAERTGMQLPEASQKTETKAPSTPQIEPKQRAPLQQLARRRKSQLSAAELLISIGLHYPKLVASAPCPQFTDEVSNVEQDILRQLWDLTQAQPELEFGGLYARMQGLGQEADQLLNRVVGRSLHKSIPVEVAEREFADILEHWHRKKELNAVQSRLQELEAIAFEDRTDEQKKEQRNLLQQFKELKHRRPDPIKEDSESTN